MAEITPNSIEALRAEIIRRRDSKIEAAKAEADRALGALNIVADMLESSLGPNEASDSPTPEADRGEETRKPVPTAAWVAEIVNDLNGSIVSQPVVFEKLKELHPAEYADRDDSSIKGQIAMILKRLETKGQLIVHKKGTGPEPTEYRKRTISKEVPVKVAES